MLVEEQLDKLFINFLEKNKIREYVFNIVKDCEERHRVYTNIPMLDYKIIFHKLAFMEQGYNGNNFLISFQEKWYNECFTFLTKYNVSRLKEHIKSYRHCRCDFYRIHSQKYFFDFFNAAISREHIKKILGIKNIVL
jgi:hypothetical protein